MPVGVCSLHRWLVEQENDLEVPFQTDRLLGLLSHHQAKPSTVTAPLWLRSMRSAENPGRHGDA